MTKTDVEPPIAILAGLQHGRLAPYPAPYCEGPGEGSQSNLGRR